MTDRLNEIRARLAAITPGPWVVDEEVDGIYAGQRTVVRHTPPVGYRTRVVSVGQTRGHDRHHAEANIEFIAHAPADVAHLLDEIKRLNIELSRELPASDDVAGDINEIRSYAYGNEQDIHPPLGDIADRLEKRLLEDADQLAELNKFRGAFDLFWIEPDEIGEPTVWMKWHGIPTPICAGAETQLDLWTALEKVLATTPPGGKHD